MKTNTKQLLHPVLTTILDIKIAFTLLAVIFRVVDIFQNMDTAMMTDWVEIILAVVAVYGAWLMLHANKLGFYLVVIPNLIIGIISMLYLSFLAKGVWMSFGQIALLMLLMLLKWKGKNAYQVLWSNSSEALDNSGEKVAEDGE